MVFTGIVEHLGTISSIVETDNTWGGGNGLSVTIVDAKPILGDVHIGDSIICSGICLTVTEFDKEVGSFKVGIAPETVRRTNLGAWKVGDKVNLERAMLSGVTRLGGHVVCGHVDCPITIVLADTIHQTPLSSASTLPRSFVTSKGYVCLNGASLTVINVDRPARCFEVMLIAHSQTHLNIPLHKDGEQINLEVDELAKYVENVVRAFVENGTTGENDSALGSLIKNLVDDAVDRKLKDAGIIPKA
ncbi:riboflavin synthase [Rhizoclosmatium globosum]|uniref:Riboflavin synthase n=1 Tax=Rhizoclosmatium globosum TaxID=329046 RepID=A0A1Y2CHD3_9FUNG|nr:riboflavin synthase [Rhizoclosmatium globosum]|eukprot:ORY46453.1 riboflavin synthase [Rhizoclosmatium globosum]